MKSRKTKRCRYKIGIALIGTLLLIITSIALAQSGGDYDLSWWTVDNGGGNSAGGAYAVSGVIGQPDAGALMSGGQFSAQGGFLFFGDGVASPPSGGRKVYLPLIVSQ